MSRKSRFSAVFDGLFSNGVLSGEYCRKSAFMWLIHHAAFKPHDVRTRSGVIHIQRGQVVVGRQHLAKEWQWSEKRVRTFLGDLAAAGMLEMGQREGQYANVATICNYDAYQSATAKQTDEKANEGPAKGQREASEGPAKGHTVPSIPILPIDVVEVSASARPEWRDLEKQLLDAAGESIASQAIAPGLANLSAAFRWIDNGCDLQLDVLPTIRTIAAKPRRKPIMTWDYFTQPVVDAKAARLAPLPAARAPQAPTTAQQTRPDGKPTLAAIFAKIAAEERATQ